MSLSQNKPLHVRQAAMAAVLTVTSLLLAGCAGFSTADKSGPLTNPGTALHGQVHGGQQPIIGASMYLYAAGTQYYSSPSTNLLNTTVLTDSNGVFNITGDYTCTPGQMLYMVAMGGNPGSGYNPNAGIMAALGDCSGLNASTNISMNEVTTVASVYALAAFMGNSANVGTSPTNSLGLAHAFASVNKLANIATGTAAGPALPAGATAPVNEINTLADIIATCVNSTGGSAGDGSACGRLFDAVTPAGSIGPTDTIGAAIYIADNPTSKVTTIFNLTSPTSPFSPQLSSAPADWTMSINYTAGGFSSPKSTTIDANGNVWVANAGNNTVTLLTQTGSPAAGSPLTGNGLSAPGAVAMDAAGNAWIANTSGTTVSAFTAAGGGLTGSPFSGAGGVSHPSSIAIDAGGSIWVANAGNNSVTELSATGAAIQQVPTGGSAPTALAINPQ